MALSPSLNLLPFWVKTYFLLHSLGIYQMLPLPHIVHISFYKGNLKNILKETF